MDINHAWFLPLTRSKSISMRDDEIVLRWKMNEGIENSILHPIFSLHARERFLNRSDHYQRNYGLLPQF